MTAQLDHAQAAALYDAIVVPRFASMFGRWIVDAIPQGQRGQLLSLGCGTGYPAYEMLRKMDPSGRVIGVDRNGALIDIAKRRAVGDWSKRIFFKVEPHERLTFGAGVFDMVTGNLVLESSESESKVLGEMHRVLAPGGTLLLTRAIAGTFEEVFDMIREVALSRELPSVQRRVDLVSARYPDSDALAHTVRSHGFVDVDVRWEDCHLSYLSPVEMLADPMVRLVGLPEWRWALRGDGPEPLPDQALLDDVTRALRTYFGSWPVTLSIRTALVTARSSAES